MFSHQADTINFMKENNHLIKLGQKIKKHREALNLSQEALAHKCDFDRTYISLLERGKRNPSYLNLLKLCKGLEIELSVLMEC
jgi:transcriptional regulator with XRE-family HTH domain